MNRIWTSRHPETPFSDSKGVLGNIYFCGGGFNQFLSSFNMVNVVDSKVSVEYRDFFEEKDQRRSLSRSPKSDLEKRFQARISILASTALKLLIQYKRGIV